MALAATKGEYALIGAPDDKEAIGAAWVFLRTGTTWAQQGAKLTAKSPEETGTGEFGYSVAVSGEGKDALMGAPGDKTGVGAAWVFTRSGTTWTQQGGKLTGSGEIGEGEFGKSVALSAKEVETNKLYALIGGPGDNGHVGAAWVFLRTGTSWAQQTKLTGSGEIGEGEFGNSVALSAEGKDALLGGPGDKGEHVGAAWVFTRSGTTWTQQGEKLTAKSGEEIGEGEVGGKGQFAYSVALSPDGNTALIGAPNDNGAVGAAWVFTRTSEKWTQQGAKLTAKSGEETGSGEFGKSVALSKEAGGTTYALIGAPNDNEASGAAWVFTRTSEKWTQQGAKLTGTGETGAGQFGASVGLSEEVESKTYALIGGPGDASKRRCGVGLPAHGNELGPAGREAHREKRGRDRRRRIRQERGALRDQRRIRADRRPQRQRSDRRGVGLPAHGHDLGPAGRETHGKKPGRDRRRLVRLQRGGLRRRQRRADGRPGRQRTHRRGVGLHALGRRPGPSRARSSSRKPGKRSEAANSARAWRSPPKKSKPTSCMR